MESQEIIDKIREFVKEECQKPENKYGFEPYINHFFPTARMVVILGREKGLSEEQLEVLEIAVWLHDIGSIIISRENHHITSCEIAEKKLKEIGYDKGKIEKVKKCIFSHRGSLKILRESNEAEVLAEADALSHFDAFAGLFQAAFVYEKKGRVEARKSVLEHLKGSYEKLSSEGKEIIQPKFEAAMLLLEDGN